MKSKFCEQGLNDPSEEKGKGKESTVSIKPPPPPPPPAPLSPSTTVQKSPTKMLPHLNLEDTSKDETPELAKEDGNDLNSPQELPDDDFGDFQTAG